MDVDAILASLTPHRRVSALERWEQAEPDRAEKFWRLIDGARAKGVGVPTAVAAWDAACDNPVDRCPVKYTQVLAALRRREGRAA